MALYSIQDLSSISGIKAHTIRIWEQRYGLLTPTRTKTNIRVYDDAQMRRLLNTSTLLENGHKISKIAALSDSNRSIIIQELIERHSLESGTNSTFINQLIVAGLEYDEHQFNLGFVKTIKKYGMPNAFLKVIYPMLVRVGLMWTNSKLIPAQEHFISNLIIQKLHAAIERLPETENGSDKWLLFLPENEDHEIGLLLSSYLLSSYGKKVYYLGQRVPLDNAISAFKSVSADAVLFFFVKNSNKEYCQNLINEMESGFKGASSYAAGLPSILNQLELPDRFYTLNNVETLIELIEK